MSPSLWCVQELAYWLSRVQEYDETYQQKSIGELPLAPGNLQPQASDNVLEITQRQSGARSGKELAILAPARRRSSMSSSQKSFYDLAQEIKSRMSWADSVSSDHGGRKPLSCCSSHSSWSFSRMMPKSIASIQEGMEID
jgi:hypothetical protein